jgi:hypothetical protein
LIFWTEEWGQRNGSDFYFSTEEKEGNEVDAHLLTLVCFCSKKSKHRSMDSSVHHSSVYFFASSAKSVGETLHLEKMKHL